MPCWRSWVRDGVHAQRPVRALAAVLVGLVAMAACASPGGQPAAVAAAPLPLGADWTTYHGDATRAGYVPDGPDPAAPAVAWRADLDGAVYASPIVVGGLLVAATEGGSLYGLDAATGAVRWRTHLADPVPGSDLPCGNIDPLGITGTPVYDPGSGQVFAVAARPGVEHILFAVDARSGQVRTQRRVDAPGSEPATHLQRGALLLADGMVYIPYGGNSGDCGQYLGRVVGVPVAGDGPEVDFAVPTTREGGIWAASGPAALPGGDVLVTTGNGEAVGGVWDHSDSILRLSPQLRLLDGFAPSGWAQENSVDADLGSTGPVVLPGAHRVLAAGKGGGVYLADVDALGGVGGERDRLEPCHSYGGAATTPGPGGGAVVFLPCMEGLLQVRVGTDDRMARGWQAGAAVTGSPVVVGTTVWSVQQDGTLDALDAATGQVRATLPVGAATRFATPAVSGGALFVPTLAGITAVAIRR
ncbi:PQQ-binding-like beta-propeller repeat protein [Pseudonocardia xinjiangensis]|uniref:PQQ-binding-like beta-propeller repeat protein n=1 Tax=Pseudonocardia xinjiangensis TaxID=75289 RepID=A0ABX1REB6_9PSEU|nr:PQQ-binding-like beta-propeller repeat protein [Pseudonocardia xinjiangensis]NMH77740.1 PQQ-binding-like beta-propeller repeat protein [Pseudonocardia xinjiangensis]